jgi:hypothetical protein
MALFLLPRRRTYIARASSNLSPRSVPNIAGALRSWVEKRRPTSSSTSVKRRCSNGTGRPEDHSERSPMTRLRSLDAKESRPAREPDQGSHRRESHAPGESFV